ncbi:MAG TPA: TetR/AcrR family transcriptional regulator [Pseudonocardia sp.]
MDQDGPVKPKSGGRLPRGASRRKLVEAALDHFAAKPYDEVTAAEVAQSAGVAHGLLFHYFQNKRGLYLAALDEAARQLNIAHETDPAAPPGARIRQLLRSHLEHLASHEHLALNLILRGIGNDPEAYEAFERTRWRITDWASEQLELDPEQPGLRPVWRAFARAADELTVHWLSDTSVFGIDAVVEGMVELLIGSLLAASALQPGLEVVRQVAELRQPGSTQLGRRTA